MYLAIAVAGAVLWALAVVFVVAACRVASGVGSARRTRRSSGSLLGRGNPPARAVAATTAREAGDMLAGTSAAELFS